MTAYLLLIEAKNSADKAFTRTTVRWWHVILLPILQQPLPHYYISLRYFMALIHLKDIHLAFGVAPVLDGIDFAIDAGERVCLIGRNGEGKSTLFKLINGSLQPDSGEIITNSSMRVAMLEQDVPETSGRILDIVMGGSRRTADRSAD